MMPRPIDLYWRRRASSPSPRWMAALLVATVTLAMSLVWWWQSNAALRAVQLPASPERVMRPAAGSGASDGAAGAALRKEIETVNGHIDRLNEQWDRLLADTQPSVQSVRLLEIQLSARDNRLRAVGLSQSTAAMMDYAADLSRRPTWRDVALVRHERDETGAGYRFMVEATWATGR